MKLSTIALSICGISGNAQRPSLDLDFVNTSVLDPRITFTRATTATFTGSNGLIQTAAINAPRFDYSPTTLAPLGLLIEEQRTNLVTYSEQFDNAAWVKTRATVTANATVAPDGTTTAEKLIATVDNNTHFINQVNSYTSGLTYIFSTFAKKDEWNFVRLGFPSDRFPGSGRSACFNLDAGTVGETQSGVTASIQNIGNGWYRCVISADATSSGASTTGVALNPQSVDLAVSESVAGDGISGIYIWGADLEAGAFPTSYIPTVASQVTRSADVAVMTGTNFSDWYNQAEGTLFVNATTPPNLSTFPTIAALSDGTTSNRTFFYGFTSGLFFGITTGGVSQGQAASLFTPTVGSQVLLAAGFKVNDVAIARNGIQGTTDTSATIPVVDRLFIGNNAVGAATLNGTIRQLAYYPRRLANSELVALTS